MSDGAGESGAYAIIRLLGQCNWRQTLLGPSIERQSSGTKHGDVVTLEK